MGRERARLDVSDLTGRFPKLPEWETGARKPTLKQLEQFATATHTPVGYLLLQEPPEEPLPIPDFRTMATTKRLNVQALYRDDAEFSDAEPLPFIGPP